MERRSTLAAREGSVIACKRGCAACCYEAVDVTEVEAAALLDRVDDVQGRYGVDVLLARCEDQLQRAGAAAGDGEAWLAKRLRCVFLDQVNDDCLVYDLRPHRCRALVVAGTSEHCGQVGATYTQVDARAPVARFIGQALTLGRLAPALDLLPRQLIRVASRRARGGGS